jgi:hypothetical protein
MPQRSQIAILPPEIKAEFEKKLLAEGFRNYDQYEAWFAERGFEIKRSTAHRYGQQFEDKIAAVKAATDMAVTLTDSVGDDAGKMNDAIVRMYQEKLFKVFVDMKDIDAENINFVKLGRAIADITRYSVSQKKWLAEARKKAIEAAADCAAETAKKEGVSPEALKKIRRDVLKMAQ